MDMEIGNKLDENKQFPNGILLRLYKYTNSTITEKALGRVESDSEEWRHFAFGNFDYISFRPVEKFADYYSESSRAVWHGHRQDVMLYALSEKEERYFGFAYDDEGEKLRFRILQNGAVVQKKFLVVSMLYVSGTVKDYFSDYSRFLIHCKNVVLNIVRACNAGKDRDPVVCEVFGTFNSSEIAILWGTDQFTDVQYIVDHIRYCSFEFETSCGRVPGSAFISTYSIIASGDTSFKVDGLRGKALVQLVSRVGREALVNWESSLEFLESWDAGGESREILCCVGEYDFIYSDDLPILEQVHRAYDGNSHDSESFQNKFWKHFSRGATRIAYREEDVSPYLRGLDWNQLLQVVVSEADCAKDIPADPESKACLEEKRKQRQDAFQEEIKGFLEKIEKNSITTGHISNFYYELLLLKSDYIQCISTSPDVRWARDFQEQYAAAIQILDYLFSESFDHTINAQYLENTQSVIKVLQHQIRHISDAGKLFFEEPYSHLESTGRYDLLFHMYYGVVKEILERLYQLRDPLDTEEQKQNELVPIVRFQPVQIIVSDLFFSVDVDKRLVDISIPYDAWCEPCFYMPFLVHELYHYVVPVDRRVRNRLFTVILAAELTVTAFAGWLDDLVQTESLSGKLEGIAVEEIIDSIIPFLRSGITSFLYDATVSSPTVGNSQLPWQNYEQKLVTWTFDPPDDDNDRLFALLEKAPWSDIFACWEAAFAGDEREKSIKLLCGIMMQSIKAPVQDPLLQTKSAMPEERVLSDYFQDQMVSNWGPMTVQLRELFPDLAMVSFTGANVCDYLMLFAFGQEKLGNTTQDLARSELCLKYRIGFILDWIFDSFDKDINYCEVLMKGNRKEFLSKYKAYVSNSNWRFGESAMSNAEESADGWFSFFESLYFDYLGTSGPYRPILAELGKYQFSPLCAAEGPIKELCGNYFSILSHTQAEAKNEEFQQCIKAIHMFQNQPLLEQIFTRPREKRTEACDAARNTYDYDTPIIERRQNSRLFRTDRVSELTWPIYTASAYLQDSHRAAFGMDTCKLWYRGSQNADFDILPSIMVHFFDNLGVKKTDFDGQNAVGTLWEYQRSILEHFKYRADGAAEFINPSTYSACDYMALMQHYAQYTTYLDWSEDAYTSLYFALEDYILGSEVKRYKGKNAALYVMDPMLYNRARRMLIQKVNEEHPEEFCPNDTWYHKQSRSIQEMREGHIPNLSISYNKRRYGIFSFDVPAEEDVNISREIKYLKCAQPPSKATLDNFPMEMWNLPLAVYTSRLNPRLRAQSGMFLAFSPFSLPVYQYPPDAAFKPSASCFSYLSLLNIQKYFLNVFPNEKPFIYEIRILNHAKAVIGEQLKLAGINKYRIYPELENLDLGL